MPVTIRVDGPGGGDSVLWNDPDTRCMTIDLPGRPDAVILDPDNWILKTVQLVDYGVPPVRSQPNPVLRSVRLTRSVSGGGPTEWRVLGVQGRGVASKITSAPATGDLRSWVWGGTGPDGRCLPAGVYLVRSSLPDDPGAPPATGRLILVN